MCTTCGCGSGETKIEGHAHQHRHADGSVHSHAHEHGHDHEHDHPHDDAHEHEHVHADGSRHSHSHRHNGAHAHDHGHDALHYGQGPAHSHAPGLSQSQMVSIERGILDKNDAYARGNRRFLSEHGVLALNFVSSPGSGKTTLLVETIKRLAGELPVAVIEGDQQTSHDADRIRATGARAIQVNTGKGCHLDASMVEHALAHLELADDSLLFIENVGNLVCPAAFDLGEAAKVVVLSVTEGEDKPLKYPDMFAAASLMLLNKVDLLPHLSFDVDRAVAFARRVNPQIEVLQVAATKGEGMDAWLTWLRTRAAAARRARRDNVEALKRRVAELEVTIGRLSA